MLLVIGLTGGIGSGKSAALSYISSKGFPVIDSDNISREIVFPGSEALSEIVKKFGEDILNHDGTLNRKALGNIVFSDNEKLETLNHIMHGRVLEVIIHRIAQQKDAIVFIDAPLLIETGLNKISDEVWIVDTPDEIRIERIKKRDHLPESEIIKRFNSQLSREKRNTYGDVIFDNSKDLRYLYQQIDVQLNRIMDKTYI